MNLCRQFVCFAIFAQCFLGIAHTTCSNPCPFNWLASGGYCYRLVTWNLNWSEAESYCQQLAGSRLGESHLASIHSAEENRFVVSLIQASQQVTPAIAFWLGYNDRVKEGVFEWSDGSNPVYANWSSGQPDNRGSNDANCAVLAKYYQWRWDDRGCSAPCFFVCKGMKI